MPIVSDFSSKIFHKANVQKSLYSHLVGSALALEIASFARQQQAPILCIVQDNQSANQLKQEIDYFAENDQLASIFPDWETLPYDSFSPHQDIISARIEALHQFLSMEQGIILIPVSTLVQKLTPRSFIEHHSLLLKQGQKLDPENFIRRLTLAGYKNVSQVYSHGEFAVRGAIIDLYPSGAEFPLRLDFFDDELDTLREFDVDTQISKDKISSISLLPAHEFAVNDDTIALFRQNWRSEFDISRDPACIYQQISNGAVPQGIEYYLPFFHEQLETLFDYLPDQLQIIELGDWQQTLQQNWQEISERFQLRKDHILRPALQPQQLYLQPDELNQRLKHYRRLWLSQGESQSSIKATALNYTAIPDVTLDNKHTDLMHRLLSFLEQTRHRTLITAESPGRQEQLAQWLSDAGLNYSTVTHWRDFVQEDSVQEDSDCFITVAPLSEGFIDKDGNIQLIAEAQLYGDKVRQSQQQKQSQVDIENVIRNLAELQIGAPVVHLEHGIGRYLGLQKLDIAQYETEFLAIEYAGGDKFYVPVQNLDAISRFSGNPDAKVVLSKLGNEKWSNARKKAAEKIRDVAAELLEIHAQRAVKNGHSFSLTSQDYRLFSAGFPFEETTDQRKAIEAVINDLKKPNPMDRLVCGDVGFGKTEVAMRAAFIVANAGYQVSILVPTTLLAQQHFDNFRDRFADWPFRIEVLSRFVPAAQQKTILSDLQQGKVDIVIGTHKLLQKDIKFKCLGMTIIDEEHRFGVRQKEKLKAIKANVDILSLTATPIPRTLNMALSGLRDLSIIATPPQKRLAVKTFVRRQDDLLIKDAITREIRRGGQIFYVHNDVASIERKADDIRRLLPEVSIAVGHGQMKEVQLERVMQDFYHHRYQLLICTTIIETGIDIPNANTIIIDRADHFGLAQLHQLRGRVGRSHHQAYAYLLTPHSKSMMTSDAKKRLQAIESMDDLGSGFLLASQDLEIRGAGEILGEDQSGQIQHIGFNLYMDMLDKAVEALSAGREPSLNEVLADKAEIELQIPALLPDDYVIDVSIRLNLYKRIASAGSSKDLDALKVELIDRFGLLPEASKNLFGISLLRLRCNRIGIKRIQLNDSKGYIDFIEKPNIEPMLIIELIQQKSHIFKLDGPSRLRLSNDMDTSQKRLSFVQQLLHQLENG